MPVTLKGKRRLILSILIYNESGIFKNGVASLLHCPILVINEVVIISNYKEFIIKDSLETDRVMISM